MTPDVTPDTGGTLKPALVAAVCVIVVAGIGGLATQLGPWYNELKKPTWQPPDWLFGPAWTLIFALIATAGVLAWKASPDAESRTLLIALFAVNAMFNIAWSVLFFTLRRPDWALIEVVPFWLSIIALMVWLGDRHPLVVWLLLPYAAWVAFAAYLNLTIVRLNQPF